MQDFPEEARQSQRFLVNSELHEKWINWDRGECVTPAVPPSWIRQLPMTENLAQPKAAIFTRSRTKYDQVAIFSVCLSIHRGGWGGDKTRRGQDTTQAVCLLRFYAGGLSCSGIILSVVTFASVQWCSTCPLLMVLLVCWCCDTALSANDSSDCNVK